MQQQLNSFSTVMIKYLEMDATYYMTNQSFIRISF
jgi:hypothetical protein